MRIDSVRATVRDRNSQGDNLFGQQVDLPRPHDRFQASPTKLQVLGMRRQSAPDIGDPVDLFGRFDIREDCSDLGILTVFVYEFHRAHYLILN